MSLKNYAHPFFHLGALSLFWFDGKFRALWHSQSGREWREYLLVLSLPPRLFTLSGD